MDESNLVVRTGHSTWFCLNEFLDNNLNVIKKLHYIDATTVKTMKIDDLYTQITAYHTCSKDMGASRFNIDK